MDDYDSFIDEARDVLELIENGEDVGKLAQRLERHAELIDPSTWPTTSADPLILSEILTNLSTLQSPSTSPPPPEKPRQRSTKPLKLVETIPPPPITPNLPPRSSSFHPVIIILIPIVILTLYYYFTLPPKCPRPIW